MIFSYLILKTIILFFFFTTYFFAHTSKGLVEGEGKGLLSFLEIGRDHYEKCGLKCFRNIQQNLNCFVYSQQKEIWKHLIQTGQIQISISGQKAKFQPHPSTSTLFTRIAALILIRKVGIYRDNVILYMQ